MGYVNDLQALVAELNPSFAPFPVDSKVIFKSVENGIHKWISFGSVDSHVSGNVYVLSRDLYPFPEPSDAEWEFSSAAQIHCELSNFITGDMFQLKRSEYSVTKAQLRSDEGKANMSQQLKACFEILDSIQNPSDIVDLIERRPRYSFQNKWRKQWYVAVWRGLVDPVDRREHTRLDRVLEEYKAVASASGTSVESVSARVKAWNELKYIPGKYPVLQGDESPV